MASSDDILSLAPPRADLRLAYGGDENQFVDLRLRKSKVPRPLAIAVHGGYWRAKYDLGYMGHLCAALTAKGIATANLECRRGMAGDICGYPRGLSISYAECAQVSVRCAADRGDRALGRRSVGVVFG